MLKSKKIQKCQKTSNVKLNVSEKKTKKCRVKDILSRTIVSITFNLVISENVYLLLHFEKSLS